jgi:hypothetical protein
MRIDVRVSFDVDQQTFCFELFKDEFGRFLRDGFPTGEVSESLAVGAVFFQRGDGD